MLFTPQLIPSLLPEENIRDELPHGGKTEFLSVSVHICRVVSSRRPICCSEVVPVLDVAAVKNPVCQWEWKIGSFALAQPQPVPLMDIFQLAAPPATRLRSRTT